MKPSSLPYLFAVAIAVCQLASRGGLAMAEDAPPPKFMGAGLWAVDRDSGKQRLVLETDLRITNPAADGGLLFVGTEEGLIVTLSSEKINFEVNSSTVSSHSRGILVRLANIIKEYPEDVILIAGHTDSDGAADYNLDLSKMRAQAVADIFIANGIDPATMEVRGYGETQPIATNNTAEGKAENRRVELTITIDESKVPQG